MILIALFFTLLLLAVTEGLVRLSRGYALACLVCVLGLFCLPFSMFFALNSFLVLIVALACGSAEAPPRIFRRGALGASLVAYMILFVLTLKLDKRDYSDLRERYPFESGADRLSYETRKKQWPGRVAQLVHFASTSASPGLEDLEALVDKEEKRAWLRTRHLRQIHELHDSVVGRFIMSPGFGNMRRIEPGESSIKLDEVDAVPLPPEDDYFSRLKEGKPPLPVGEPVKWAGAATNEAPLWAMHRDGLLDFVNPRGFGYIEDRHHVAGFQPHRFSKMPNDPEVRSVAWKVQSVELVSLLKYETPRVYLSKHLPRMKELRTAQTRPLDDFERSQLPALQKGEDLMVSSTATHMRVLGSLRAGKQCLSCHDAERGDLLGAFSYKLRREQP
jgi:hypothetical protein